MKRRDFIKKSSATLIGITAVPNLLLSKGLEEELTISEELVYEPLNENKFLLRFPSDFGIQELWAIGASMRYWRDLKDINLLSLPLCATRKYTPDEINITLVGTVGSATCQDVLKLINLERKCNYELELIDSTGHVMQKWLLANCVLRKAWFSGAKITLGLKTKYCTLI